MYTIGIPMEEKRNTVSVFQILLLMLLTLNVEHILATTKQLLGVLYIYNNG